jgi:Alpha-glucosidases, family 31 of glycosyl hydrolases
MKHIFSFFLAIIFATNLFAADYTRTAHGIKTSVKGLNIEIQFVTPEIVRIYKTPENSVYQKTSYSVIKTTEKVKFTIVNVNLEKDIIWLQSKSLQIFIDVATGKISFHTLDGKVLFTEKDFGTKFTPFNDAGNATFSVSQQFIFDDNEAIYGLGQQQIDKLNQRNSTVLLKQRYLHACIPIFQSVKGYGVFWDNYSATTFTDNEQGLELNSEVGECVDYYFMYGKSGDGVVAKIRELTGQSQMFPLWTYGFWQSRERFRTQYELTETVAKYRELGIPLDGIIQDWQYWGGNTNWNSMNFDNPEFPDPQAMVDYVHSQNAHIMISIWASFGPDTKPYADLKKINALFDFTTWPPSAKTSYPPDMNFPSGVRVYDAYNPQAREIYWNYLKRGLYDKGIDAWWLDSTEPDHHFQKESDFDQTTAMGTYRSVINLFPLMTNKGVYENLRAETSDKRVFLLTRCAFAGQQRYAAQTWSGDVESTWDALRCQVPTGLNFSLSGIPYWNSDIGGFFLNDYEGKTANKAYLELYTRWFQYATFTPMQRSHGCDVKKEIYNLGKRGDWVFDSKEKYINLRYRLLPYIYSTAWNVTKNSGSFLRALFMDFAEDSNTHDIADEYMFGDAFLVAPITEPFYITSTERKWRNPVEDFSRTQIREVYLPKNNLWFDFWTGETFAGGQTISRQVPIDIIPVYVRAGSILPIAQKVQYATEKQWDDIEIRIYAGADGKFTLYEDENDNYNYEKGFYSTIDFIWNDKAKTLTIGARKGKFAGMLQERKFRIVFVDKNKGIGENESATVDKTIIYKGKSIKWKIEN